VDLRSNIAAEARAKMVYERLINFCDDPGSKDALQFLMTREITHMKAFTAALESMGKAPFSMGRIPPTPVLVDEYFKRFHWRWRRGRSRRVVRGTRAATGKLSRPINWKKVLKISNLPTSVKAINPANPHGGQ
jgi:Mn-containing catalase